MRGWSTAHQAFTLWANNFEDELGEYFAVRNRDRRGGGERAAAGADHGGDRPRTGCRPEQPGRLDTTAARQCAGFMYNRDPRALVKAITELNEGAAIDPDYAMARAFLAVVYTWRATWSSSPRTVKGPGPGPSNMPRRRAVPSRRIRSCWSIAPTPRSIAPATSTLHLSCWATRSTAIPTRSSGAGSARQCQSRDRRRSAGSVADDRPRPPHQPTRPTLPSLAALCGLVSLAAGRFQGNGRLGAAGDRTL